MSRIVFSCILSCLIALSNGDLSSWIPTCPFAQRKDCSVYKPNVTEEDKSKNYEADGASKRQNLIQQGIPFVLDRVVAGENIQLQFEEAERLYQRNYCESPNQTPAFVDGVNPQNVLPPEVIAKCEELIRDPDCDPSYPYRTADGTCNNLQHTSWGSSGSCFQRLADAAYSDGISGLRISVTGCPLPNARELSVKIHKNVNRPSLTANLLYMQFGQFMTHDMSLTLFSPSGFNESRYCCPPQENQHPTCLPIIVKPDDPFFSKYGVYCLDNLRSAVCPTCTLGSRDQANFETAFIDGSQVYGYHRNLTEALRTFDGTGTLRRNYTKEAGELLPLTPAPDEDFCSFQNPSLECFTAGDERVNQNTGLTSLHTLFHRHHNRLARKLHSLNSDKWDDEKIFQEARRILGAQLQMIMYNEFLDSLFEKELMKQYSLAVLKEGYTEYVPTVDPTLANEFSAVAFRFGHSLINTFFPNIDSGNQTVAIQKLRDNFFYPFDLYKGQLDKIIRGMSMSQAQRFDRFMVNDVTDFLYKYRFEDTGMDLASLNFMRTLDHGIPTYVQMVRHCRGPDIKSFHDLLRFMDQGNVKLLQGLFKSVHDIDFFTGGFTEKNFGKSKVGFTFTCVIAQQFNRLKFGDRFYFEHSGQVGSFTPAQLKEIRKTTLAKIICENTGIKTVQRRIMNYITLRNPLRRCSSIPDIDLTKWRA